MFLPIILWVAAAWMALSTLIVIAQIGKPRPPITAGVAITSLIITGSIIAAVIAAAIQLS